MKILVIGGSYFLGRVFVMLASPAHEVTVVNRGNQPLAGMNVREIRGERHDAEVWKKCSESYDVLVDFCAYQEGDIQTVIENLAGSVKQYIFISTVDVYRHGMAAQDGVLCGDAPTGEDAVCGKDGMLAEDAPFETRRFPGEAGDYITGKVALEKELPASCDPSGIRTTVLRPAILYGPLNYAPRETVFIQLMVKNGILPVIEDADGKFQLLYVKDGAEAIMRCLLNPKAYGQSFNLCGEEIVDYKVLADSLEEACGEKMQRINLTRQQAQEQGFPLPFPAVSEESHLCDNGKSKRELEIVYTSLEEGMRKTYRAFQNIFRAEPFQN